MNKESSAHPVLELYKKPLPQVSSAHSSFPATQFLSYTVNNGCTLTNIWCMLVGSCEREKSPQAADHTSSCSALTTEKSGSGDVSWGRGGGGGRKREEREREFTRRRLQSMYPSCVHASTYDRISTHITCL